MRNAIMANTFMAGISALLAGSSLTLLFGEDSMVKIEEAMVRMGAGASLVVFGCACACARQCVCSKISTAALPLCEGTCAVRRSAAVVRLCHSIACCSLRNSYAIKFCSTFPCFPNQRSYFIPHHLEIGTD